MNNEFVEELKGAVEVRLNEEDGITQIDVQEVVKNNDTTLTGLVFKGESDISPIIYINDAFKDYEDGKSLDDIADELVSTYHQSVYHGPENASDFLDYEKVKDKLIVCVLNKDRNEEMLKETPHKEVENIALIARIEVTSDGAGIGTVKINDQLLNSYKVSEDELFEQAWKSMNALHPMECKDMVDIIKEIETEMPEDLKAAMDEFRGEMYVIQSDIKLQSAAYGFNSESLNKVCEQIESPNIYILPSSVNEVIVIPENKVDDPTRLTSMVGEVNADSVPDEDFLSNNAYFYNSETQELSMIDDSQNMTIKM